MDNILVTTGYKQQSINKLQFDNVQKRKIQSCGSVEHFKVAMEQKGSSLIADIQQKFKRYSAQDYALLKFNMAKSISVNQETDAYSNDYPQQNQQYKCSILNFNPSQLIPQQCIQSDKLPQLKRTRSFSEGNTFKKISVNKSQIFPKTRSKSGFMSLASAPSNLPQFSLSNYQTLNNTLCVSTVPIQQTIQDGSSKENKPNQIQEGKSSEKIPHFFKITTTGVPHTERLSKFRVLCEKNNQSLKQSVYSMVQQSDKPQSQLLYTKYKNPIQPYSMRQRGISVNDNSPFSKLYNLNTQTSTVESLFVTENVDNKFTQLSEDRNSLHDLSLSNQENDIHKRINSKDVDKNLALSLKKLQFDKYFPDSDLTKKLKSYYEQHQKAYQEEQKKVLEKIRRIEIPEHQKAILRMIKKAQKKEVKVEMKNPSYNFGENRKELI